MSLRKTIIFFIGFIIFLPGLSGAGVKEYRLSNGIEVIMVEDHKAPLVVFQIWYRVGSVDEVSGSTGQSHLLEHMMFKGTPAYASKVLSRTVQRHGGTDNAFTSKDYTAYFQILPSEHIGLSLRFESDRMRNIILDAKETLAERSVVMEERRLRYEDDPQNSLYEGTVAAAFKVHPYRRPVIGWMSDLQRLSREGLAQHYQKYYSPDNAFIVVVGDIDPDSLITRIEAAFGSIKTSGTAPVRSDALEPLQRGERRVTLKREAELPFVVALYHAPNFPHADAYALDVLDTVLSGGKSGRLYRSLVYDKKMAISAYSSYDGVMRYPYLFSLGATASPGTQIAAVEAALYDEVQRLIAGGPTEFELQKSKNQLEADYIMGQDSLFYQAMLIGRLEIIGDWRIKDEYVDKIRAVTAADVVRVAKQYLVPENRTVGVLIPTPRKKDN